MSRAEQRARTREQIVDAAVEVFADQGFRAASTRTIAERAGVTQGLLTYHFASKDELWRAVADQLFGAIDTELGALIREPGSGPEALRAFVRFNAAHPEVFRLMVDAGRRDDERLRWLVERHLAPRFAAISAAIGAGGVSPPPSAAHLYYAIVGAASLIFAVAPECRRLTGSDPEHHDVVEAHADLLVDLFFPAPA